MKKKWFISFAGLFLLLISMNGQNKWAPEGAKWYYTEHTINPEVISYTLIKSIDDTLIKKKTCKKLEETNRYQGMTIDTVYHYMYSENDSVFFFNKEKNDFCLLYDFSAKEGDTIKLHCFSENEQPYLTVIVDSVKEIMINDSLFMKQYVTSGDGLFIGFGNYNIENIGNDYYMFPTYDGNTKGPLRCYSDSVFGKYKNPKFTYNDCDKVISSIKDKKKESEVNIYPNPAQDFFYIESVEKCHNFTIEVYDILGNLQIKRYNKNKIIIKDLISGIYIVKLIDDTYLFEFILLKR